MIKENSLIGSYLVLQEKNGIVVARNTRTDCLDQLVKLPTRLGGQKAAFQALVRDLQGLMSLQNENAQIVDDAFEYKRAYYLALRFVEAAPLEKILRELKVLSMDEVKRLANQVGGALISAHGLGVVHGNLDIRNILVNKQGDYILSGFTDLPLSKYKKTPLKYKPGSAPELLAGEEASFASDQYSLAKLLKNLVDGAKKATDFKKSDLSQGMVNSLNKALNKNPNERYTDVNAFMRAFNGGAQANKNSTNAARSRAGQNSRKQDRPMDLSEIPPSYLPSDSMTSGAESALSQAISSSAYNRGFFDATGSVPAANAQNPYAMWSGVSPIEAQSHAETMRVGVGKPPIVVEDFEIAPAKTSNEDKDLSMRNIPKYKPAFDVDLSESSSKSADVPFPFDDETNPANPPRDRMRTFVLAFGMVLMILVGVTVALLGGNTPIIKLPGSKDVSANLDLSGVMQSTLAKGAFPTGTPDLISVVPIATQFPGLQTEVYAGTGGSLYLSPTPTATITLTPTPSATPELEVPGAFATAPANSGVYWDIVIQDSNQTTQEASSPDALGGQGPEIYWDILIYAPTAETALPMPLESNTEPLQGEIVPSVPTDGATGGDAAPEITSPEPVASDSVPTAPSSQGYYWDIVIDFPSPQETVAPNLQTPAAPAELPRTAETSQQTEAPTLNVVPTATPEALAPQAVDQTGIMGANLQTQVAVLLPESLSSPAAPVEQQAGPSIGDAGADIGIGSESQGNQGGSPIEFNFPTIVAPKPTPIPMQAGSQGSGSDIRVVADSKPSLVVTVVDGLGRPVADHEVMILPVERTSLNLIDTPLQIVPTIEYEMPLLPFLGGAEPDLGGRIGRTDSFGQIHFDLDPGSFQVVYVPSGQVDDSDAMAHYQVEVAAASRTELTLHRELVTVDFLNVEGEKVELPGLGLVRLEPQERGGPQDRNPAIIPLTPSLAASLPTAQNLGDSEAGNGGTAPESFSILDLTPGKFELVQIGQDSQDYTSTGLKLDILQGQAEPVEVQLGRLVLPASFLEQSGKVGDVLQVIQQVTASGSPSQSNEPVTSLTYQGEAVLKIDLLPGTYSLNWAGTEVQNIKILSGEASDVYVGHKGGK